MEKNTFRFLDFRQRFIRKVMEVLKSKTWYPVIYKVPIINIEIGYNTRKYGFLFN